MFEKHKNEEVTVEEFEHKSNVSNIVASGSINQEIELQPLAEDIRFDVNQPEVFPAIVLDIGENITSLVFDSGKFVLTGGKNFDTVESGYNKLIDEFEELFEAELDTEVEIRNIVYTARYNTNFTLEAEVIRIGMENCEYEPEQFGAIMYPMPEEVGVDSGHALIFSSGTINIVGGQTIDDINTMKEHLEDVLEIGQGFYDV